MASKNDFEQRSANDTRRKKVATASRTGKLAKATALLGAFVALCTAWALVLPAISITDDKATNEAGFYSSEGLAAGKAPELTAAKPGEQPAADNASATVSATEAAFTFEQEITIQTGETLVVRAQAGEGAFADDVTMLVEEVADEDVVSAAVDAAANDAGIAAEDSRALAVDITFVDADGAEVQPANGDVHVTMQTRALEQAADLAVVHVDADQNAEVVDSHLESADFATGANAASAADGVAADGASATEPAGATADAGSVAVAFDTPSFSVYAIVYTVDFEYEADGQIYSYSMPGGTSMMLSELFDVLGIGADAADVTAVEFSDPELLAVSQRDSDWLLESLEAFDTQEELTITFADGEQIVVKVTDDNSYSSNLSYFLSIVAINADTEDGKYIIKPGKTYAAHFSFKEDADGYQFAENGHLEYSFPEGFTPSATSGTFTIVATSHGVEYPVEGNAYRVENGKLIIDLNTSSPNYQYVESSPISTIDLNIEGVIDTNQTSITWSDTISTDIKPDLDQGVSIEKSISSFNPATGVITYQLKVKSLNGANSNIVVSDHMDGTAVAINQDVTLSGAQMSSDGVAYTRLGWGDNTINGFSFTIPSMAAGAEATVTYTATIDKNKLIANDVNLHDDGQNHVSAHPDEPGRPDTDSENLRNLITAPTLTKSSSVSDAVGGKRTITWTIVATSNEYFPLAGGTIRDAIQDASRSSMKYSGNGLSIVVTDANGASETRTVSWSQVGVNNLNSDYGWTYNVPSSDTGDRTYVITYTTEVDVSDFVSDVSLKNDVSDPYKHATGEAVAGPDDDNKKADVDKTVGEVTAESIAWTVNVTVPVQGLTTAKVTDTLPKSDSYVDTLHGSVDDVTISGLDEIRECAVKSYENNQLVINFQKLENGQWVDGLLGGNEPRTITISFSTDNNSDWMTKAESETWRREHTNNVSFQANQTVLTDSATGTPMKSSFKKTAGNSGEVTVDGVKLPVYYYTISVSGVTGPFDISDTFDSRLVPAEQSVYSEQGKVYGGDQYHQGTEGSERAHIETTTDGKINIHVTENSLAKQSGGTAYYSHYKLMYALRVKDAAALESLKAEAAATQGGKLTLTNTATSPLGDDSADVTYEHKTLTKELLNDKALGDSTNVGEFRINVNPDGYDLDPESDTVTLTDTFSNTLSIDYNSIKVEPAEGATWYVSGNVATFTLPDETPLIITYKAKVIGNGDIHFENTAEIRGQIATVEKTEYVTADMGGTSGNYNVKILKHKRYDFTEVLGGATFGLFDGKTGEPITKKNGERVTFTTDENGMSYAEGNQEQDGWSLHAGKEYYLKELEAPEGYVLSEREYRFQIASDNVPDYEHNIYFNGDTLHINNTPVGGLEIKKSTYGIELDDAQKNAITFTVTKPDGSTESKKLSEFTDGKWKLTGLSAGTYTVTESGGDIDGYERTTSYSVNGGSTAFAETATVQITDPSAETSVAFINRYKSTVVIEPETLQLKVQKKWFVGEEDKSLADDFATKTATMNLKRYRAEMPMTTLHFRNEGGQTEIADDAVVPAGSTVTIGIQNATNIRPMTEAASMWTDAKAVNGMSAKHGKSIEFTIPESLTDVYVCFQSGQPGEINVSYTGGATAPDSSFTEDTSFAGPSATITGPGSKTFNNLPLTEQVGGKTYVYKYYVAETPLTGFSTQYQVNGGAFADSVSAADAPGTEGNATIVVKNAQETGVLQITKDLLGDVTGNEDKAFKVTVMNSAGKYLQSDSKTFGAAPYEFTVSKATPLSFDGLPIDTYTATENTDAGEVAITDFSWNSTESTTSGEATLVADQTQTIALKNYYNEEYTPEPSDTDEFTNLVVDKDWVKAGGSTTPASMDTIKFKVRVKSADAYVPVEWHVYDAGATKPNASQSGKRYVQSGKTATFSMNRYDDYVESGSAVGKSNTSFAVSCNVPLAFPGGSQRPTVYNKPIPIPSGVYSGGYNQRSKIFERYAVVADQIVYEAQPIWPGSKWVSGTPSAAHQWSFNLSVEDDAYYESVSDMAAALIDDSTTSETLVYTLDNNGLTLVDAETSSSVRPETATASDWVATLSKLPAYAKVTVGGQTKYKVYSYEIEEIEVNGKKVVNGQTDEYTVATQALATTDGTTTTITNTEKQHASLDVVKVDSNGMTKTLGGAAFQLRQIDPEAETLSYLDDGPTMPRYTGDGTKTGTDGKASFADLAPGYYEVKETETPAGYILASESAFYIKVENGDVSLVERAADGAWKPRDSSETLVFTAKASGAPATAKLGNDAGSPLPNTGGSGVIPFAAFGGILVLVAGTIFFLRKRTN